MCESDAHQCLPALDPFGGASGHGKEQGVHRCCYAGQSSVERPGRVRWRVGQIAKACGPIRRRRSCVEIVFLALGMWDECISSNIDSWNSSEDRVKRMGLGSDDRSYHALWWMQYAYLQKGFLDKALENLSIIEQDATQSGSRHARDHQAYLRAHFLVDGEQWAADLRPVDDDGLAPRA